MLFPYDLDASERVRALDRLPVALINTPHGDWAAGKCGWIVAECRLKAETVAGLAWFSRVWHRTA